MTAGLGTAHTLLAANEAALDRGVCVESVNVCVCVNDLARAPYSMPAKDHNAVTATVMVNTGLQAVSRTAAPELCQRLEMPRFIVSMRYSVHLVLRISKE